MVDIVSMVQNEKLASVHAERLLYLLRPVEIGACGTAFQTDFPETTALLQLKQCLKVRVLNAFALGTYSSFRTNPT